jgi:hypothetical protein
MTLYSLEMAINKILGLKWSLKYNFTNLIRKSLSLNFKYNKISTKKKCITHSTIKNKG